MKKKIVSFIAICCLVFPCLFSVACKQKDPALPQKAYTFSVTLKNAKEKVDESSLQNEYDFEQEKEIAYTLDGNDYKLSVTKSIKLNGELKVNLIEGVDYSNLSLKVNNETKNFDIKNGNIEDVANNVNLRDRYFKFTYEKMDSDTNIVVDFSNCETAKISLDVTNLKANDVKYGLVSEEFLTLSEAKLKTNTFSLFDSNEIQVDYGTIIAFDFGEQLAFKANNTSNLNKLSYANYGSKYLVGSNGRVQYMSVTDSGLCEVYSVVDDSKNDGTIRALFDGGVSYAGTLDDMLNANFVAPEIEKEKFGSNEISIFVFKGGKVYIELNSEGLNYNYYLVDRIDDELVDSKGIQEKTISSKKYLEIDLTDADSKALSAKYLARKPKNEGEFYIVSFSGTGMANIENANYVLVGNVNKPSEFDLNGEVFYGYSKGTDVILSLNSTTAYSNTDYGMTNKNATINVTKNDSFTAFIDITQNPAVNSELGLECCTGDDVNNGEYCAYSISIIYDIDQFNENAEMTLETTGLNLYDGEEVYITTDIKDSESWVNLMDYVGELKISQAEGRTIYYYIDSPRTDAVLQIQNERKKFIGITGALSDCFGRTMNGTFTVMDKTINLSQVSYIEIEPGIYNSNQNLRLVRGYDRQYHQLAIDNLNENDTLMISLSGYSENSFVDAKTVSDLQIRTEYSLEATMYYYVDCDTSKYVELTNQSGEIVSTTEIVYVDGSPVQVNGKFVYSLSLKPDYHEEGNLAVAIKDATFKISNETGVTSVYTDAYKQTSVSEMVGGTTYFIVGDKDSIYQIVDKNGAVVIQSSKIYLSREDTSGKSIYYFTLNIDYSLYVPSSEFVFTKI